MVECLFEDEAICVNLKPAGMDFHEVRDKSPQLSKFSVIYPLDKELCGPLVYAKTPELSHQLKNAYGSDLFDFEFILWGYARHPIPVQWACDLSIAWENKRAFPSKLKGKKALTCFTLEKRYGYYHKVKCLTHYLRQWQILIHAYYGQHLEILGDEVIAKNDLHYVYLSALKPFVKNYASRKALSEGLHVCLQSVRFSCGERKYNFTIPLPNDWTIMEKQLKRYGQGVLHKSR